MKHKVYKKYQILNYIVSTNKFKLIFLMTLVLSLYGVIGLTSPEDTYIASALIAYQFDIFNLFTFLILFLNTLNTCTTFNKEFSNYIIRLKSRKKYIIEMLKTTFLLNIFFFILLFLLYFMILNVFKLGNIQIVPFQNYNINNLIYLIFYLIRYAIYGIIIMAMTTMIYINFKEKFTLGISALFLVGFLNTEFDQNITNTFIIKPWSYFSNVLYSSFLTELKFSILYLIILIGIILILYIITLKNKRYEIT